MGSEFTFYDYVDEGDRNIIFDWLEDETEVSKKARVKFQKGILNLEGSPPPWPRPFYAALDKECAGLFELRVPLDRQYRILGFHNGRTPTLVHCFVKSGRKVPPVHCERANAKKAKVLADPAKHRVEHKHGKD